MNETVTIPAAIILAAIVVLLALIFVRAIVANYKSWKEIQKEHERRKKK